MNLFKKIYCRSFQFCFRIAIPFMPYRKPQVIHSVDKLVDLLNGHVDVLLVTDAGIVSCGLDQKIIEPLKKVGISVHVYDKTHVNPTVDNIEEGAKIYRERSCSAILSLGGGSSMDCAKGIGARIARPKKPINKMKGVLKVLRPLPLLIAIPTTAGTGSECTLAAVITDPKTHSKYAINDFCLIPKVALLDPKMTLSLPPHLTASTGMDALTHAIEAYIGNSTTKDTREAALSAISLIYGNLEQAVFHGDDLKARENMAKAAYLAGLAFTKSYVGYVHALAHALGGFYGVPHGLANAILLPVVLKGYNEKIYAKIKDCAIAAGLADKDTEVCVAFEKMISSIESMNERFRIGTTIKSIKKEDLPALCKHADAEANPLYPVPVLMDAKELEAFYLEVMEDSQC